MIAIVDYGVGNIFSLYSSFKSIGAEVVLTGDADEIRAADKIILPGVGAFPDAAERLRGPGLDRVLVRQAAKKPILGICLGMQLLFDVGEEVRECSGLGLVHGSVRRIKTDRKLPHIGWNSLSLQNHSPLFQGLEEGAWVYFVHSFCGVAEHETDVIARTEYGPSLVAAVSHGNVYGCQFHPEKSGEAGLQILRNFGGLNR